MGVLPAILVTGAGGFIGARVAAHLHARGHAVIGLDRRPPASGVGRFPYLEADLNDVHRLYAAVKGRKLDAIVHCGGASGLMVSRDNPFLICETNIRGSMHVFEMARLLGPCRVVFCSSASAYGNPADPVITEDTPLRPTTVYGASKAAGEAILRAYAEEHGVDGIALRITHVYGPGRETQCFIRQMIEAALAGRPARLPQSRHSRRQYVHVTDVVEALALALDAACLPQRAYNVGSAEQHTLAGVADAVRQVVGPFDADFDDANDPPEYRYGRLDIAAAARDLGYQPKTALGPGIAAYAAWLRARR
jgi:nucleoside-diphosphate-sugar epimerase